QLHQPNFTIRLHAGTPQEFLDHAVGSIACGNGMPQVLNDAVIIQHLRHSSSGGTGLYRCRL
ncbi:MAG: hypothetical protein KH615_10745, partial [Clostridiales bacterium]|nr:hypothetical protein [Clostridiales bacterium]